MASTNNTNAKPPLLVALPAALLGHLFEYLDAPSLVRTLTMTSKDPAFARFVNSEGVEEAALWTRLLRLHLGRFTPSRAWFDLKGNSAHEFKPMRDRFQLHVCYTSQLPLLLALAGLRGVEWAWEGPQSRRTLALLPASVPEGKTMANFLAWTRMFRCIDCDLRGAATTMCVACGRTLCPRCIHGCDMDDVECADGGRMAKCPFALCGACQRSTRSLTDFYDSNFPGMPPMVPGFLTPICTRCPPDARWCHAHPDVDIVSCWFCQEKRCKGHWDEDPAFSSCSLCTHAFVLCARRACHERSHYKLLQCGACGVLTCSQCVGLAGPCPHCGGKLGPFKPYDDDDDDEDGEDEEGA